MKLLSTVAAAAVIGVSFLVPSSVEASTVKKICSFNKGYGTPIQVQMPCDVSLSPKIIEIRWKDGAKDIYSLQYGNSFTDTRGGIWRLTTTRETGPIADLLFNQANGNQVIIE